MIFVDRNNFEPPIILNSLDSDKENNLLSNFYSRKESSRSQEKYNRPFSSKIAKDVLPILRLLFRDKCAYCESPLPVASANGVIGHFRPKHNARGFDRDFSSEHYWWLTYEWQNLYFCCEKCNRYKSTWFPVEGERAHISIPPFDINFVEKALLLDPCFDKPEDHLNYLEDGLMDFLTLKGKTTIELLKLNRAELINARKASLSNINQSIKQMSRLWNEQKKNLKVIKEIAIEWRAIFAGLSDQPYLGIKRQFLSKWLNNKQEIQAYLNKEAVEVKESELIETTILKSRNLFVEPEKVYESVKSFNKEELQSTKKTQIENVINFDELRHVYIERLELKNYKCFSDFKCDFPEESSGQVSGSEPWLLFLGENGVGKTSMLKAITIALCGENYFEKIGIKASDLLRHGQSRGYIKLFLKGEETPINVKFNKKSVTSSIKQPKANLLGYGSIRLLPKTNKLEPEEHRNTGVKAQNLFDYSVSLVDADRWLLNRNDTDFDRVALTLKELMSLRAMDVLQKDFNTNRIYIKSADLPIYIEQLSDGYQSIYLLTVDIMAAFAREGVTYNVAEGIVLIDEIGTHLHPRWKMQVVSQLKRAFPRLQFIVTSHEPLCLRGLHKGEVSVLAKDENNRVYAITDLPDPSAMRVDQILNSPFFGLYSTVDPSIEALFDEYYALLAKNNLSEDEESRKLQLSDQIPKMKYLGDTLREELAIYIIDEMLAQKGKNATETLNPDLLKLEAKKRVKTIWDSLDEK